MVDKLELIARFKETMQLCNEDEELVADILDSKEMTEVNCEGVFETNPSSRTREGKVRVVKGRTLETASKLSGRIGILDFASAKHPGGGVTTGARAQEESICRCTTLYPVLNSECCADWYNFNNSHREHSKGYIYIPDVTVIKKDGDSDNEEILSADERFKVDVIVSAAPNLAVFGSKMTNKVLLEIHKLKARQILSEAENHGVTSLVLGAFGCGVFRNDPEVVAKAYREVIPEFAEAFDEIVFAIYCDYKDTKNFDVFKKVLGKM